VKWLERIADLCWEGLTLKHVSNRKIVIPYLLFVIQAFVFELFLAVIFTVASVLSIEYGFRPGLAFYVSGVVLMLLLIGTITILITLVRRKSCT
jgi:hypothetical protein